MLLLPISKCSHSGSWLQPVSNSENLVDFWSKLLGTKMLCSHLYMCWDYSGVCQERGLMRQEERHREDVWVDCELVNVIGSRVNLHVHLGFLHCFDWPPQCIWDLIKRVFNWTEKPYYLPSSVLLWPKVSTAAHTSSKLSKALSLLYCIIIYSNALSI